jgi:L-serine dehydratase
MGYVPTNCPPDLLNELNRLPQEKRVLHLESHTLPLLLDCVTYGPVQHNFPYSNTLFIDLLDHPFPQPLYTEQKPLSAPDMKETDDPLAEHLLFSREYYSTGGGFLQWKGWEAEARGHPAHPYVNMNELLVRLTESGLQLDELLLENETAITGASPETIIQGLDHLLELMKDTVRRGCRESGLLPGIIGMSRKAGVLFERATSLKAFDRVLCFLNAYAFAAAEENAAGNIIVTAPTCGAAGVVPAITLFMQEHLHLDQKAQRKGLLAAAAVGFIAKENAGIAGAEVGCQGEIGVASAMAAAMLAEARGYSPRIVSNAAEIALEHHLGLTCDPVGGSVQIPCIERNAVGAVKAYNAALIACNENPAAHLVSYDDALRAMAEIGRDMNSKYKETSTGGLAVCLVVC